MSHEPNAGRSHVRGSELMDGVRLTHADLLRVAAERGVPRLCHCCGAAPIGADAVADTGAVAEAFFCAACHALADEFNAQGGSPYLPVYDDHRRHAASTTRKAHGMAAAMQRELRSEEAMTAARHALAQWRRMRVGALLLSAGLGRDDGFPPSAYFERVKLGAAERAAVFAAFAAWWRSGAGCADQGARVKGGAR